jgi:hypothetical protein
VQLGVGVAVAVAVGVGVVVPVGVAVGVGVGRPAGATEMSTTNVPEGYAPISASAPVVKFLV